MSRSSASSREAGRLRVVARQRQQIRVVEAPEVVLASNKEDRVAAARGRGRAARPAIAERDRVAARLARRVEAARADERRVVERRDRVVRPVEVGTRVRRTPRLPFGLEAKGGPINAEAERVGERSKVRM